MVLAPENIVSTMQHQQVQNSPITQKLSSLDNHMENVLKRQDISDDAKVKMYNQTLQRYLEFYNQRKEEPISIKVDSFQPKENEQQQDSSSDKFDEIEQEVLDTVPKTTKTRARLILNKIKSNKDIIRWNDRGELIYHGKAVPSTHIVDLIRDIVKGRKSFDSHGWQYFCSWIS